MPRTNSGSMPKLRNMRGARKADPIGAPGAGAAGVPRAKRKKPPLRKTLPLLRWNCRRIPTLQPQAHRKGDLGDREALPLRIGHGQIQPIDGQPRLGAKRPDRSHDFAPSREWRAAAAEKVTPHLESREALSRADFGAPKSLGPQARRAVKRFGRRKRSDRGGHFAANSVE